jgi:uncharacterized protein YndB with AHSA1/START domain
MRKFSITTEISAPPERVWEVMSDIDRWHEWTPSITSVERLRDAPLAVGSQARVRQPKLPPAVWTVTAIDPGRSFTWVSSSPGVRVVGHHAVESTDGGSRATLSIDMQGLLGGLVGQMTKGITERYIGLEATGLKARSENPEYHHGRENP